MLPTIAYRPAAPQGHRYALKDIVDCPVNRRYIWLSRGLRMGDGHFAFILYHYLVQEYRSHPNKKRTLFIFDHCLSEAAVGMVANVNPLGEGIDLSINYSRNWSKPIKEAVQALDARMATCRRLRAEYLAASWWGQLQISLESTRPPRWLFDDITNMAVDGEDGYLREEMLKRADGGALIVSQSHYNDLVRRLPITTQAIMAASFDTNALGVDGIEILRR